mgnify:CR=1 FL=1
MIHVIRDRENGGTNRFEIVGTRGKLVLENGKLTFTRNDADHLDWQVTVDDPKTWTKPFTFMIRLKRTDDQVYEYACHEGNHSMIGILAGARAD